MTSKNQRFYPAIAQPEKGAGGAVAKGKAEVEQGLAVAQIEKGGKKWGLLDEVKRR